MVVPPNQKKWGRYLIRIHSLCQVDPHVTKELDLLRCRMTCRIWSLLAAGSMGRLVVQQLRLAFGLLGTERKMADLDPLTLGPQLIFHVF